MNNNRDNSNLGSFEERKHFFNFSIVVWYGAVDNIVQTI